MRIVVCQVGTAPISSATHSASACSPIRWQTIAEIVAPIRSRTAGPAARRSASVWVPTATLKPAARPRAKRRSRAGASSAPNSSIATKVPTPAAHHGAGGGTEVEQDHLGDRPADVAGAVGVEAKVDDLAPGDRLAQIEAVRSGTLGVKPGAGEVGGGEVLQAGAQAGDGALLVAVKGGDRRLHLGQHPWVADLPGEVDQLIGAAAGRDAGKRHRPIAGVQDAQHQAQEGRGGLTVKAGVGGAPALHRDQALGALIDGAVGERVIDARPDRGEEVKGSAARRGGSTCRLQQGTIGLGLQDYCAKARAGHVIDQQRRQRGRLARCRSHRGSARGAPTSWCRD